MPDGHHQATCRRLIAVTNGLAFALAVILAGLLAWLIIAIIIMVIRDSADVYRDRRRRRWD